MERRRGGGEEAPRRSRSPFDSSTPFFPFPFSSLEASSSRSEAPSCSSETSLEEG